MQTQSIQYLIVALVVATIVLLLLRKRAQHLKLRIEPVSGGRLDNTPVERNEIVGEVRVRARVQPATLVPEHTRIEPTIDKSTIASAASDVIDTALPAETAEAEPTPSQHADTLTFYPGSLSPSENVLATMPTAESDQPEPALTQEDMFPNAAAELQESTLGGINESELAFDRVISIHIMARNEPIPGRLLLEHLLQYGLRYGDMAIFHRHEHPTGQGSILFSLAQAMEPGTFDIDTLSRASVPGVSLFLGLPGYKCLVAYDLMIDTARRLANALQADMLDEQGQVLTAGKLADWRDEVVAFDSRLSKS
ncbi:MAG: cell division protein ZipA [Paraperlucidibaca sp.]